VAALLGFDTFDADCLYMLTVDFPDWRIDGRGYYFSNGFASQGVFYPLDTKIYTFRNVGNVGADLVVEEVVENDFGTTITFNKETWFQDFGSNTHFVNILINGTSYFVELVGDCVVRTLVAVTGIAKGDTATTTNDIKIEDQYTYALRWGYCFEGSSGLVTGINSAPYTTGRLQVGDKIRTATELEGLQRAWDQRYGAIFCVQDKFAHWSQDESGNWVQDEWDHWRYPKDEHGDDMPNGDYRFAVDPIPTSAVLDICWCDETPLNGGKEYIGDPPTLQPDYYDGFWGDEDDYYPDSPHGNVNRMQLPPACPGRGRPYSANTWHKLPQKTIYRPTSVGQWWDEVNAVYTPEELEPVLPLLANWDPQWWSSFVFDDYGATGHSFVRQMGSNGQLGFYDMHEQAQFVSWSQFIIYWHLTGFLGVYHAQDPLLAHVFVYYDWENPGSGGQWYLPNLS
jgi:hypothetical protein